ncbi:MAG: hypothetical protein ACXQTG_00070 [Methanoculleaceae archaeon]
MSPDGALLIVYGVVICLCLALTGIMTERIGALFRKTSSILKHIEQIDARVKDLFGSVHETADDGSYQTKPVLQGED